ncbi:MAG: geranylgeranyl reductase family protein, partial [Candidatus Aenigmarchaeota archaeon]|nr:geranylgeranyl reductase family protein [Candidatus Aenigmarchaeota archaeon]
APKRCGEGISDIDIPFFGFNGNENFILKKITGMNFILPDGREMKVIYEDYRLMVERKLFDKALAYKAADAGAKIIAKANVVDVLKKDGKISGVKVSINGKSIDIYSKIVIASDGVESKIARIAGLNTTNLSKNIAPGFQYEMAGIKIDSQKHYLYMGNKIVPRGYIWIFPKGGSVANVGIGLIEPKEKTAKEYLDDWIQTQPNLKNGSIIEVNSGGIPLGGFLDKMTRDNFMVVGDAAHQVNPLHGGGMSEAGHAGKIAAEVAIKAIKLKDTSNKILDEYNKRWWSERGNKLKKAEKYRKIYTDKLKDEDIINIFKYIDEDILLELTSGRKEKIFKVLFKNPKLLLVAKYFL